MKIEAPENTGEFFSVIVTEHRDKKLEWNATDYERGNDRSSDTVFRHINQFFATLPMTLQDKIWDCYIEIKDIMDNVHDHERLQKQLTNAIHDLYKLLPLEKFSMWIHFKSDITVPPSIKEHYDYGDLPDRTYIRKDYDGLILLSLALRPIVPIWSEFNSRIKGMSGNTYKEYQSMGLLVDTEIFEHPAMQKLRTYVEASTVAITSVSGEGNSVAAIIGGLGTTELPAWLLALSVVRRVAIGDLDSNSEKGTIISNVYKYIYNNVNSLDKRFKGRIKSKETSTGDDEDNASIIEGYKVKQDQSDGDLVTLTVFTENTDIIVERLQPDLDLFKLQRCLESVNQLMDLNIHSHQITLTQLVIHPIIPARGIPQLSKQALLKVMAICQAVLWHRGFTDIALLVTARPSEMDDDTMLGGYETRSLIPKELMDELIKLYPYYPALQNKQQGDRKSNPASKAIDSLSRDLVREEWNLMAPVELTNSVTKMLTPADIKAQLAKFIIDRVKRSG